MRWYIIGRKAVRRLKVALTLTLVASLVGIFTFSVVGARLEKEAYLAALAEADESKLVIIDAGHGAEDCGAVGTTGVYEKDLNLEIAKCIGEMLKEKGYNVIYTREDDRLLYTEAENIKGIRKISDLKNRAKIANEHPSAVFVSIHMNSYAESKYSGLQVWYTKGDDRSAALARSIQTEVARELQPDNNRATKAGDGLYLLEKTKPVSVLVECGFLTNPEECARLCEKEYQKQLSLAIVCGIINYIEGK